MRSVRFIITMMLTERGAAASGGVANNTNSMAWKMGRIMLRYRPIAPKPPVAGLVNNNKIIIEEVKSKRKVTSTGRGRGKKRKVNLSSNDSSSTSSESTASTMVTLPLMPETPEGKDDSPAATTSIGSPPPQWLPIHTSVSGGAVSPAASWVTVEAVTDTWRDGEIGGGVVGGDGAVVRALELDSSPAFVSDEWGRACWTNEAYRRMVVGPGGGEAVSVGISARAGMPLIGTCRAFTCMVRVRYCCRRRGTVSLASPCDVWRLDAGGLAWRLDLKAALSLSL